MVKTVKVKVLKPFNNGSGVQKVGSIISIPEELLYHYSRFKKVVLYTPEPEPVKEVKKKAKKVTKKVTKKKAKK